MTDRHLTPVPNDGPGDTVTPPHDPDAERAVLGALLTGNRTALTQVTETITGADHYTPRHELIHDTIEHLWSRAQPIDIVTVGDQLHRTHTLERAGGRAYLHDLHDLAPIPETAGYHARIVAEHASRRRLLELGNQLRTTALTPGHLDLHAVIEDTATDLEHLPPRIPGVDGENPPGQTIDAFLAVDDDDTPAWIIDGVLERMDRLIVTAGEGVGKSTFLRQIAVQTAAGIHPFNDLAIPPLRVVILDLENSPRQIRRKIRPLVIRAGVHLDPTQLIIESRPEGIDLTRGEDRAFLDALLTAHKPDLLVIGPLYKLTGGNPNDEVDVKPAALYLDALRAKHDVALLLEAHSKKGEGSGNSRNRPKEPFGWSGWMRWPEFGLHLHRDGDTFDLTHWRGMRDERDFPEHLNAGTAWPFTAATTLEDRSWHRIKNTIQAAGKRMSQRELADATGIPRTTVQRIISERSAELAGLYYRFDQQP